MTDFLPDERLYFACLLHGAPHVLRLAYVGPGNTNNPRSNPWIRARNDHGTEQGYPLKYLFKWREDAEVKAEELDRRGRSK